MQQLMDCVLKFEELEQERQDIIQDLLYLEQQLIKALEKDPRTLNRSR